MQQSLCEVPKEISNFTNAVVTTPSNYRSSRQPSANTLIKQTSNGQLPKQSSASALQPLQARSPVRNQGGKTNPQAAEGAVKISFAPMTSLDKSLLDEIASLRQANTDLELKYSTFSKEL